MTLKTLLWVVFEMSWLLLRILDIWLLVSDPDCRNFNTIYSIILQCLTSWPPGVKSAPKCEVTPRAGWRPSVCSSVLLNIRKCSPLGMNEGVSNTPGGKVHPWGPSSGIYSQRPLVPLILLTFCSYYSFRVHHPLLTGMTSISLHMQWPLTSQSHGCVSQREQLFLLQIKLHALIQLGASPPSSDCGNFYTSHSMY
jgi:hypothetical protein